MVRMVLSVVLVLCTLGAYAEYAVEQGTSEVVWLVHEYPSELYPTTYSHHIHRGDFRGGCGVTVWSGGKRLRLEAYDNRWYGKQLVQVVMLEEQENGSIVRTEHRTETYVGEEPDLVGYLPYFKKRESKPRITGSSLPIAGYDVFSAQCLSTVSSLPPEPLVVFQHLYQDQKSRE
jgi:hypothetical protein